MRFELFKVVVEREAAEIRIGQVAVGCVPRHVALKKNHIMPTCREGSQQSPKGRRMAIPPGGGQALSEDDHAKLAHATLLSRLRAASSRRMASTSAPRRL